MNHEDLPRALERARGCLDAIDVEDLQARVEPALEALPDLSHEHRHELRLAVDQAAFELRQATIALGWGDGEGPWAVVRAEVGDDPVHRLCIVLMAALLNLDGLHEALAGRERAPDLGDTVSHATAASRRLTFALSLVHPYWAARFTDRPG